MLKVQALQKKNEDDIQDKKSKKKNDMSTEFTDLKNNLIYNKKNGILAKR